MNTMILIAAGGTGGHVFPALAVADALHQRGGAVEWLGSGGIEMRAVKDFPLHVVPFSPPRGLLGLFKLSLAVVRAWRVCRKRRPHAVLGMGGYASAPAGLAAKIAGIPLIIHEQNAVSGRANRLLAKVADKILCGFPNALPNSEWVGNPVRAEFCQTLQNQKEGVTESSPHQLLILGGSQGARALNLTIPTALSRLCEMRDYAVVHQCGRGRVDETMAVYQQAGYQVLQTNNTSENEVTLHQNKHTIVLREFISDIAECMAAADFVICRAGAATLAELATATVPALLVPYPHAAAGHQLANANFYAEKGAAFVCEESQLSDLWLSDFLQQLTPATLQQTAKQLQSLSRPQAAAAVADICLQMAGASTGKTEGQHAS